MDVKKHHDVLNSTIKKYYRCIIYIVGLASLLNILSLAMPLSFMSIIDRVLISSGYATLIFIAVLLTIVAFIEAIIGYSKQYLYNWFSSRVISDLSGKYFDKLMVLNLSFFNSTTIADHITRVGELYTIKNYLNSWLLSYVVDFIFLLIYLSVMVLVSPILTLIIVVSTPFHIIQYFLFGKRIRSYNEDFFNKNIELNNSMINSLTNIEMIKLTNYELSMSDDISKYLSGSLRAGFRLSNLQNFSSELSNGISKIFEILLITCGSYLVLNGILSLGELVAFTLMKDKVVIPLIRLASLWEEYSQFRLSKNRIDKVFGENSEPEMGILILDSSHIEFDSVSLDINGCKIFSEVNLVCGIDKIVCITGESGAGKSNLIKMIPRLISCSSGNIYINKVNINDFNLSSLREKISYLGQECHIFNGTIRENILWDSCNKSDEWLMHILEVSQCKEFVKKLEKGLETYIGEGGVYLSGGQRQRIALARCFASNREIFLLDEPTSALDEENERKIVNSIIKNSKGKITIIISHNERIINSSDLVYRLK
ncbi:peptidase domain-containing ABC transporter [Vibrio cholerae]